MKQTPYSLPSLAYLLVVALLLAQAAGGVLGSVGGEHAHVLLVYSTNDTDLQPVKAVLAAAGISMVDGPIAGAPGDPPPLLARSPSLQAANQGTAYSLQGDLQALQAATQLLPAAHILHVVRDIRSWLAGQHDSGSISTDASTAAARWAARNSAVKAWATKQGLGLAWRYSIARIDDLCNVTHTPEAAQRMLLNAGIRSPSVAVSTPAIVQQCPSLDWQVKLTSTGSHHNSNIDDLEGNTRDALMAFGYQPLTGLGLPAWLEARPALAHIQKLAEALAAQAPAPAIVTFVSNGYEPILNNWLSWLRHSRVDLSRVVLVAPRGTDSNVRARLLYKDVHVVPMAGLDPDQVAPGTSHELGARSDPNRHARARVWLQRIRLMHTFVSAGVPVVMSDLDAIWMRSAVADLQLKAAVSGRGFDLMMSPGFFPFDVHKQTGVVGCMGFLYANATSATQHLLGVMLREKVHQLKLHEVKFFNDQRVLNEQLLQANIALNNSASQQPRQQGGSQPVLGEQLTTAPQPLRVLFLPDTQYTRVCSNSTSYHDAVVVHCQSFNSGAAKMTFLHQVGLWWEEQPPDALYGETGMLLPAAAAAVQL